MIIAYIDMMLVDAIQSSPNTAPQKSKNRAISKYLNYLGRQWSFGADADDAEDKKEMDGKHTVNVVNIDGLVMLRAVCGPD